MVAERGGQRKPERRMNRAIGQRRSATRVHALALRCICVAAVLIGAAPTDAAPLAINPPAAANDLRGSVIVGYQGWLDCPGDDPLNPRGWSHWFSGSPDPDNFRVDLLPFTGECDPADLCATQMRRRGDGAVIHLFSSLDPSVVKTHFRWMAENNIAGAAVQRFVNGLGDPSLKSHDDRLLSNVRAAAETYGRVFYVTYDVSGANPATVFNDIRNDWRYLVEDLKLTASPRYLRYRGKPVLEIWGFGFVGPKYPSDPAQTLALLTELKSGASGVAPVTLIGGVPSHWRTLNHDSSSDSRWEQVYRTYDVLSPWTVGRFSDSSRADRFLQQVVIPDLAETGRRGIEYLPVIYPGYSFYNASRMGEFGNLAAESNPAGLWQLLLASDS